ncbi:MAG TPA: ATP-grasp domain-containing protein [Nitrosopumilaceae archaeon]|nr:ATP-grasp domain-containing protein [Nitrosopumilaceae archaeon]
MRLLEYQAKSLFADYGIRIPKGLTSTNIEQGRNDVKEIGFPFVIKAQMAVGGRGKAGAIQKCHNADEFELKYPEIMQKVVKGEKTKAILLEKMVEYKKELYLSLFLNRGKRGYTLIASSEGGVEIESVKNQVIREVGLGNVTKSTTEEVAKAIGLKDNSVEEFVSLVQNYQNLLLKKRPNLSK